MTVVVTPFIYVNDGDNPHAVLVDILDTASFASVEDAERAMNGLRKQLAESVFADLLTVEFDID